MAEAMLYEQAGADDTQCESIVTFVEKNKDNEKIKDLYERWESVCATLQIDITYVRWKLDNWFQDCYLSWKDLQRLSSDVSHEMANVRKDKLFEQFLKLMDDVALKESQNFINKLKVETAKKEIMANYRHCQEEWIDKAVECVQKEIQLMADFKKVKIEEEKVVANQKIEGDIARAKGLEKDIAKCLEKMKNEVTNWTQYYKEKEESQQNLSRLKGFLDSIPKNGVVSEVKQLKKTLSDCSTRMEESQRQIRCNHEEISSNFRNQFQLLNDLVMDLVKEVHTWKQEFKFQFVELVAMPNLSRVAPWCAQAGRLIYDVINGSLTTWGNILSNIEGENKEPLEFQQCFVDLLAHFIQSTFVVTEQESCIIKVDKKHLPKFVVRVLAAEHFPERGETITARFAFEDDINMCCPDNNLDLEAMQQRIIERDLLLTSNSFKFENVKKKDRCEACFQTLHFKGKFSRQGIQSGKQVHEEKSRIIFTTNILGQNYWTLSLPLVVTTGANQGCLSQASVMWQCFSTDVYSVPIADCYPMPWYQMAEMLQAKMQKLCPTRKLSVENINHLKRRLFGRADVPDDEMVTLKKFCFDKLEKADEENQQLPFSFWKWFIGIYNLLDKYLLNFWKEGLIIGFISKEEAKEKLKRCKLGRSGTFLLRFSDHNITDSQGVKSVFGHLTACVLIIKEELDGRKKKKIYDMDVAGHKKLKEKNLANILKETQEAKSGKIYQFLYPGELSREDTFDAHCDKDAVVPGYTGTRDAFVVHLDQQLAALEISCGKHTRSPSIDSGIDTSSPINTVLSLNGSTCTDANAKKQRVSMKHPTIAKMLQQGNHSLMESRVEGSSQIEVKSDLPGSPQGNPFMSPSSTYGQSPSYFESSPATPGLSIAYASTPSPASSTQSLSQGCQNLSVSADYAGAIQDMSALESQKLYSLPTVIEEAIPVNGRKKNRSMVPVPDGTTFDLTSSNGTKQVPTGSGDNVVDVIMEDESDLMPCMSFTTGCAEVIVMPTSGHSSLESSSSCQSAGSGSQLSVEIVQAPGDEVREVQMSNNGRRSGEPVTSTVPDPQEVLFCQPDNPELAQILTLVNMLPPDTFKQLQNYLDQNVVLEIHDCSEQMSAEMDTPPVCTAITTSGTPVLTSSGSISEAFNFSPTEIAEGQEMNSGTIDTSVFSSVETSSGGMPT